MINYAKKELELAGFYDKDAMYGNYLPEAILELIKLFSDQNHSGMSASITSTIFNRLSKLQPLTQIGINKNEWKKISENYWQNKRASNVFTEDPTFKTGYDIEGIIFVNSKGVSFSCNDSFVDVTFPYYPKIKFIHEDDPEAIPWKHIFNTFNN